MKTYIKGTHVIDLTGKRFGRLVVGSYIGSIRKKTMWLCLCDCGKETNIPRVIGNLMDKPNIEYPEYGGQFKFMNPINSVLKDQSVTMIDKRDINECIRNYTKILLDNEFIEMYEMLFRNTKSTKTKKNITNKHKSNKRTKSIS